VGYFVCLLASGAFVGFSPVAPGTAGSLLAVALFLFFFPTDPAGVLLVLAVTIPASIWLAGKAEVAFGAKDASPIVVDEIVGQWLALVFLPRTAFFIVAAFLLFRALDIWKPWRELERIPGGFGVVVDDLVAGVVANLCLQVVRLMVGA
jgi:phosphatidylglycerophosphatase A